MTFDIKKSPLFLTAITLLCLESGCATIGAKLSYDLALEDEANGCKDSYVAGSDISIGVCERITRLIQKAGIPDGYVGYDSSGRLKLKGDYLDEDQVEKAFTIAQTLVGASSMAISPVTPRNIGEIKLYASDKGYTSENQSAGRKIALLIGVSHFKEELPKISTAEDDVAALAELFKEHGYEVITLTNERATRSKILDNLVRLENTAQDNDLIVLYISTHGTQPNHLGKLSIVPYDYNMKAYSHAAIKDTKDRSDEEILEAANQRSLALKSAISPDDLQSFTVGSNASKKVIILDTCYSGAAMAALGKPLGGERYATKESTYIYGISKRQMADYIGLAGAKDLTLDEQYTSPSSSNLRVTENDTHALTTNYLYPDLEMPQPDPSATKNRGTVMVTAASANEKSWFDPTITKNSFFTYYLVNGLKNTNGQLAKAFDYAKPRMMKLNVERPDKFTDNHGNYHSQTPQIVGNPFDQINLTLFD